MLFRYILLKVSSWQEFNKINIILFNYDPV